MASKTELVSSERIEKSIFLVRGHKVMLDSDLAELYGVPTKLFNQAVKRNRDRFPSDFMFQLTIRCFKVTNRDLKSWPWKTP